MRLLFVEDALLPSRSAAPARLDGPRDPGPTALVQDALPLLARADVSRGHRHHVAADVGVDVAVLPARAAGFAHDRDVPHIALDVRGERGFDGHDRAGLEADHAGRQVFDRVILVVPRAPRRSRGHWLVADVGERVPALLVEGLPGVCDDPGPYFSFVADPGHHGLPSISWRKRS